ncbi:UNVERIFIED_CONTAM: hypothetical protein K2H54_015486 [Gekko kuhli]
MTSGAAGQRFRGFRSQSTRRPAVGDSGSSTVDRIVPVGPDVHMFQDGNSEVAVAAGGSGCPRLADYSIFSSEKTTPSLALANRMNGRDLSTGEGVWREELCPDRTSFQDTCAGPTSKLNESSGQEALIRRSGPSSRTRGPPVHLLPHSSVEKDVQQDYKGRVRSGIHVCPPAKLTMGSGIKYTE